TGTQFNISAYRDEQHIRTTLVEGGLTLHAGVDVPVSEGAAATAPAAAQSLVLSPGEQGVFENGTLAKHPVNVAAAIAWKDGDFFFENEPLESIMNRMARWYDAEVVYEDAPKGLRFYGMVSRSKNISTVLDVLQMTDQVTIEIEGPETGQKERR